jgi:hypothetical protein
MSFNDLIQNNNNLENNDNLYINYFINFIKYCVNNTEIEKNESNSTIYNSNNKQEKFLKNLLINKYNFKEIKNEKNDKTKKSKKYIKYTEKEIIDIIKNPKKSFIKPGQFIHQPLGTQNNPDFLIQLSENILIPFEAKSANKYTPQYNSGGIKPNYIYIFTSQKIKKTTVYLGSDIINENQIKLIKEYIEKCRLLDKELNKLLKENDTNNRGVSYYTRPMIGQKGKKDITNYFEHKDKKKCEENVIEFLENLKIE